MITSYGLRIGGNFKRTLNICHFNVPIPPQLISLLRVNVYSFFLSWVIDAVCLFVIIYITFLGYLLTTFLDDIEVWCNWPVAFRGSWLLKMPESIITGFLLEFIFLWLNPSYNAHIVAIVQGICFSFYILVLEESYEALLINVTKNVFSSALSNCFFKIAMWYGFNAALRSSM